MDKRILASFKPHEINLKEVAQEVGPDCTDTPKKTHNKQLFRSAFRPFLGGRMPRFSISQERRLAISLKTVSTFRPCAEETSK